MEKYITGTLSSGEKILLEPKLHWWNYVRPIFRGIFAFIVLMFIGISGVEELIAFVFLIALVVAVLTAGYGILANKFIEMACTSKRVVQKKGIVMRDANELQNQKIEAVEVKQSILGRILGYGDVCFSGTGTSKVTFCRVQNPLKIKAKAADILEKKKSGR